MTRPWELNATTQPWASAQSLYPRTISISRPQAPTSYGVVGYQGTTEATETQIASGIAANVEIAASGRNSASGGLPGDSPGPIKWTITLPANVTATLPLIQERDVVYDDLGRRFQVSAYQPTPLGARIDTARLTT